MGNYLTIKDIAERLECSYDHARNTVIGEMVFVKIGSKRKVPMAAFEKWLEEHTVQPGTPIPREKPFKTVRQEQQETLKEWHRKKRAAAAAR